HMYMINILADRLSLAPSSVEDFILDAPSLDAFDKFFAEGGSKSIFFVFQEADIPGIECGRSYRGLGKGRTTLRLVLANLSETCLMGQCCFFVRTRNNISVTRENIHKVSFLRESLYGLLNGIENTFSCILPALDAEQHQGVLNKLRHGEKFKNNFMFTIKNCLGSLDDLQVRYEDIVHLTEVTDIDFSKVTCLNDMKAAAADLKIVRRFEEILMTWYQEIDQVLLETDQLRRLDDSAGPLSELEHWKRMSQKFNSVINHIKSSECKAVIMVLNIGKSKTIKMWRELYAKVTDHVNEAKDNVKFLGTLEKVCQPLYISDPVSIIKSLQNVFNAIHMIYNVSLYYNTDEKIAILFVKITNQMLNSCRAYLTENGQCQIWDHNPETLTQKMQVMTCRDRLQVTCALCSFLHIYNSYLPKMYCVLLEYFGTI
uniref:Dynein heavy chain tail domain-containing protein n=1 Tax=Periophthalmus magnuspinnatus TaxID=409849 RepID=A0A3B4ALM1_9GOBI